MGLFAATVAAAPEAGACGGDWWPEVAAIDYRISGVAHAEEDLWAGHYQAAAGSILRMIPYIRDAKPVASDPIIERSLRVLAVATVRSNGALRVAREVPAEVLGTWAGVRDVDRAQNLEWSIAALRGVMTARPGDPSIQTELGEALALVPSHHGEALAVLGKLAEKDLLASPEAYAALARLRGESGDYDGRLAAIKRCEAMAKSAEICRDGIKG